jgi:hypothetical protein
MCPRMVMVSNDTRSAAMPSDAAMCNMASDVRNRNHSHLN